MSTANPALHLYSTIAAWWPIFSHPDDYAEEAAHFHQLFTEAAGDPIRSVLELGSGGGNNASHLKQHFALTLVDLSPAMLDVSRALNPECEHIEGDMRDVRLGRAFDGVFVHDAVMYMTTEDDLRQVIATAAAHCRAGGVAVFAPDCVRETFKSQVTSGGHDGPDRGIRYLEWAWDPDPDDTTSVCDFAYLLHEPGGGMRVLGERHVFGVFPRQTWLDLLATAGFTARTIVDAWERDVFVAVRTGSGAGDVYGVES